LNLDEIGLIQRYFYSMLLLGETKDRQKNVAVYPAKRDINRWFVIFEVTKLSYWSRSAEKAA